MFLWCLLVFAVEHGCPSMICNKTEQCHLGPVLHEPVQHGKVPQFCFASPGITQHLPGHRENRCGGSVSQRFATLCESRCTMMVPLQPRDPNFQMMVPLSSELKAQVSPFPTFERTHLVCRPMYIFIGMKYVWDAQRLLRKYPASRDLLVKLCSPNQILTTLQLNQLANAVIAK